MTDAASLPLLLVQQALDVVRQSFVGLARLAVEEVELPDALGRVLAGTVAADRDQPPFDRSTRDGYAVRAGETGSLRVVGAIRAGEAWTGRALQTGEAIEIMTGAPAPAGADAILMLEHVQRDGDRLRPERTMKAGENIVPQGAESRAGDMLLQPGTRLCPAEIALLASVGCARVAVYARPVVAILSTGDELVSVAQSPGPQQIRNSNAYAIAALVRQNGGEPLVLPIAADTRESLDSAIAAAAGADMLVLSGGVSAGKYDLVEPVLLAHGATFAFTGVKMQPGKPTVFGSMQAGSRPERSPSSDAQTSGGRTQWIFGLPGNPVSTQVTAILFAMPMLRALGGETSPSPVFVAAELAEAVNVRPGLTRFLPARMEGSLHGVSVQPTGWQGSGDLNSNARANCYLVVPAEAESLEAGAIVRVLLR